MSLFRLKTSNSKWATHAELVKPGNHLALLPEGKGLDKVARPTKAKRTEQELKAAKVEADYKLRMHQIKNPTSKAK
jgi:hypothetical protein